MSAVARRLYTGLFQRNSVFVGSLFVTAFAFEVFFDKATDNLWDSRNKGKLYKDIKDKFAA